MEAHLQAAAGMRMVSLVMNGRNWALCACVCHAIIQCRPFRAGCSHKETTYHYGRNSWHLNWFGVNTVVHALKDSPDARTAFTVFKSML